MSVRDKRNMKTRREYKTTFWRTVRAAAFSFSRCSSRSTWQKESLWVAWESPNCPASCWGALLPSDLQLIVDVFLLQYGRSLIRAAVVPAGEHCHAVVAHSAASGRYNHASCGAHAVQERKRKRKTALTCFFNLSQTGGKHKYSGKTDMKKWGTDRATMPMKQKTK